VAKRSSRQLLWEACLAAKGWHESLRDGCPEDDPQFAHSQRFLDELREYMQKRFGRTMSHLEEDMGKPKTITLSELMEQHAARGATACAGPRTPKAG